MKLIFFIVVAAGCTSKKKSFDPEKIVGIWNLQPDTSSQSFFNKENRLDYVNGYVMSASDYKINEEVLIETDRSTGEVYQYSIVSLTDDSLILKHIRTGHVLNYKRSKSPVIVRRQN